MQTGLPSAADREGGEERQQGSLPRAPSVRGLPNGAGLVQKGSVRQSYSSLASGVGFAVFSTEVSLLFCFAFYAADANNAQLSCVATAQSTS